MKHIILLCCIAAITSFALLKPSGIVVKGTVTDAESGSPLPGATIKEKTKKTFVKTDGNGHFTITVSKAGATIICTHPGYEEEQIVVAQKTGGLHIALAKAAIAEHLNDAQSAQEALTGASPGITRR